jgi:DNA ligase (NAD+)
MNNSVKELETKLTKAQEAYYNSDKPIMSDKEYDLLVDKLKSIDPDNKSVVSIGAPIKSSEWKKVSHKIPMGSLDKAINKEELIKWMLNTFTANSSVITVDKIDGLSLEVIYKDGKLIQAITRGDSKIGDDITSNVIKMNGVRKTLPVSFTGSLRGEILIKRSSFKKHFSDMSNARNAAVGITKRPDGQRSELLDVLFYQAIGDRELSSEFFQLQFLKEELKLNTPSYEAFASKTVNELIEFVIKKFDAYQAGEREELDWDCDGLVVSVNDLKVAKALGSHHMRPKSSIAMKFDAENAITTIKNIELSTGNSGTITPVVIVDTVHLAGVNVSRASIYNYSYINEMGIDIGAEVLICRSGDVIPKILEVVKGTGTAFKLPKECPSCGGKVVMDGEKLKCISIDTCPAQVAGRVMNWISVLNVLEIGEALVNQLVATGAVKTVADLYSLSIDDLAAMDRMGTKSATNCYHSLWLHNPIPLDLFLGGLSIPMIGSSMILLVMEAGFDTLDKIMNASQTDFEKIKMFGLRKALALKDGLKRNKDIIMKLQEAGLKIAEKEEVKVVSGGKLNDRRICITGDTVIVRKTLIAMIEENGGSFEKSVSKACTHLLIADPNSTSSKAKKARANGTKLISEQDFLDMIDSDIDLESWEN